LNGNKIKDLNAINDLSKYKSLISLKISDNPY